MVDGDDLASDLTDNDFERWPEHATVTPPPVNRHRAALLYLRHRLVCPQQARGDPSQPSQGLHPSPSGGIPSGAAAVGSTVHEADMMEMRLVAPAAAQLPTASSLLWTRAAPKTVPAPKAALHSLRIRGLLHQQTRRVLEVTDRSTPASRLAAPETSADLWHMPQVISPGPSADYIDAETEMMSREQFPATVAQPVPLAAEARGTRPGSIARLEADRLAFFELAEALQKLHTVATRDGMRSPNLARIAAQAVREATATILAASPSTQSPATLTMHDTQPHSTELDSKGTGRGGCTPLGLTASTAACEEMERAAGEERERGVPMYGVRNSLSSTDVRLPEVDALRQALRGITHLLSADVPYPDVDEDMQAGVAMAHAANSLDEEAVSL